MMTSPIADLLTRLRNASRARKPEVILPSSRIKKEILRILKNHNYIADYQEVMQGKLPRLKVELRFSSETMLPALNYIELISKPGLRHYVSKDKIPLVLNGHGLAIISTSKGLMTDREARRAGVGGEVICHVW